MLNTVRNYIFLKVFLLSLFVISACAANVQYAKKSAVTQDSAYYKGQVLSGRSSYYGKKFHGRKTASGEIYNMYKLSAAHRYLPFGTVVEVVNTTNNRSVRVRINDRGPFVKDRILDLSYAAARKLGMIGSGVADVKIRIIQLGQ